MCLKKCKYCEHWNLTRESEGHKGCEAWNTYKNYGQTGPAKQLPEGTFADNYVEYGPANPRLARYGTIAEDLIMTHREDTCPLFKTRKIRK